MRTIAIVNQKGGCGKTTTAINLAALYAKRGLRTLLVDMDPQSHCAVGLGVPESRIEYSIGDALLADHARGFDASRLLWEAARNLYLAPSTVMLAGLEAPGGGLHHLADKDRRLESLLGVIGPFDRCLIDCPPTIGLLTFNALRAAREALVPVETGFFSLRGAEKQWNTIQRLIAHIERPIACHLLATLHDPRSRLACNILAALRRQFAGQIIPCVIHEHESLREAASYGRPIVEYAPGSEACADFEALTDWLEEHAARPLVQIEVMARPAMAPMALPGTASAAFEPPRPLDCTELAPSSSPASVPSTPSPRNRAAELVRRVQDLANFALSRPQDAPMGTAVAQLEHSAAPPVEPAAAASLELKEVPVRQAAIELRADVAHLLGVRQTSRGVLFVQPANTARSICIAGEFNQWSPSALPMRLNDELGVFEAIVELKPGRYQYRLVMDGDWVADPHNRNQQLNSYGEPNSVVIVSEARTQS